MTIIKVRGKASKPAGRASELVGRGWEPAGRPRGRKKEWGVSPVYSEVHSAPSIAHPMPLEGHPATL